MFVNLHERAPENFFDKYINPYLSPKYDATNMTRETSANDISLKIKEILSPLEKTGEFDELKVYVPSAGIVSNDIEISLSGDAKKVEEGIVELERALGDIKGVINIADDSLKGNKEIKLKLNSYGQS